MNGRRCAELTESLTQARAEVQFLQAHSDSVAKVLGEQIEEWKRRAEVAEAELEKHTESCTPLLAKANDEIAQLEARASEAERMLAGLYQAWLDDKDNIPAEIGEKARLLAKQRLENCPHLCVNGWADPGVPCPIHSNANQRGKDGER